MVGFRGHVPVAAHDLRTSNSELAWLTGLHLDQAVVEVNDLRIGPRNRNANAPCLPHAIQRIHVRDGGSLREPEPFHDPRASDRLEAAEHLLGQRGGSRETAL